MSDLPERVIVDQHGHYWRDYGTHLSMPPVSEENVETEARFVFVNATRLDDCEDALTATERSLAALPPSAPEDVEGHVEDIPGPHPESLDWHAGYRAGRSEALASSPVAPTEGLRERLARGEWPEEQGTDAEAVALDAAIDSLAAPGIAALPALDEAWKAAEAAANGNLYLAAKPDGRYVAGTDSGAPADSYAYGPTPAAALAALTARLTTKAGEETTDDRK